MSEKLHNQLRLLETAISRLEKALAQPMDEFIRDSAIQRFEFTFELLWKSVKTYAEEAGVEVFSPETVSAPASSSALFKSIRIGFVCSKIGT